jgi:predicted transcriptional regulator
MLFHRPLATVTPSLDGDVLAVLSHAAGGFTTGQLHRMLPGRSEEGIRRVLHRLVDQGVVTAERVGNAWLYSLNREHLAAEPIIALANLAVTLLGRLEEHLAGWSVPPLYAAVFGSAARATMTADSDIDVLLVRADDADMARWEAQVDVLAADVTHWTGNDCRPLVYTDVELAAASVEPVLAEVAVHGLTVAGEREWFVRQLKR